MTQVWSGETGRELTAIHTWSSSLFLTEDISNQGLSIKGGGFSSLSLSQTKEQSPLLSGGNPSPDQLCSPSSGEAGAAEQRLRCTIHPSGSHKCLFSEAPS